MTKKKAKNKDDIIPKIIGSTVMGERGQLVVPKEIREYYHLKSGDKFFLFGSGHGPIVLLPAKQMHNLVEHINQQIHEILGEEH